MNERLARDLAETIVTRPGWSALVFPVIPLGTGGANEIGRKFVFPGTYAVRSATLRSVFMDLASELGEQGFRWVFVVHWHGAPNHNRHLQSEVFKVLLGAMGLLKKPHEMALYIDVSKTGSPDLQESAAVS